MFQPESSRVPTTSEDSLAGYALLPPIPKIFDVAIDLLDRWRFTITDPPVPTNRQNRAEYCVYFCPVSLANAAAVSNYAGAQAAFFQSTLIATTGASNNGGSVTFTSDRFFREDGWFFCTAKNVALLETYFNGPVRSPVTRVVVFRNIPPEVSDPQIVNTHIDVLGQDVVQLDFSAVMPSDGNGVVALEVTDPGSGYSVAPVVSFTSNDSGSGAEAFAEITGGVVTEITVTQQGSGYTVPPTVVFTGANTTPAVATAEIGPATIFSGYQLYIDGYFGSGVRESANADKDSSQLPGTRIGGTLYLLPDTSDTTFYFVSLTPTGVRQEDPTAAPSVNFPGGIT